MSLEAEHRVFRAGTPKMTTPYLARRGLAPPLPWWSGFLLWFEGLRR